MRVVVLGADPATASHAVKYLRSLDHEVSLVDGDNPDLTGLLRAADVAWTERVDHAAYDASVTGACRRLVLRMRGNDTWGALDKIVWKNVHALVYESDLLKQIAEERHPFLRDLNTAVIPTGIDLDRFPFRERRPGNVVAMLARAVEAKGYQLAYEWARRRTDLRFFFAAAHAAANPRFMRYLEYARPDNITLCGTVDDVPAWLDEIGAGFLLSSSSFESVGYSIAEAMAMGIKPLIHATPGSLQMWPVNTLWQSLTELDACVTAAQLLDSTESRFYRQWIEDRLDAAKLSPKFAALLLEGLAPDNRVASAPEAVPNSIALQMIVRDDAAGLERAVLSVRDQVDEVVIGVDDRSDEATWAMAQKYATDAYRFSYDDVGMTLEEWNATPSRIHFANARNFGLRRVKSAWVLTLDSDEFMRPPFDLKKLVAEAGDQAGFRCVVSLSGTDHRSVRLARHKHFIWEGGTHNQLVLDGPPSTDVDVFVVHDTSLRGARQEERNAQRDASVRDMRGEAEKGELSSLFHLAKHILSTNDPNELLEAVRLVDDYRKRTFPHGICADERWWLAFGLAVMYINVGQLGEAEVWAIRSLLDGPRVETFCILGDIAEEQNDLQAALRWYEAACSTSLHPCRYGLPALTNLRHGRLVGIRRALAGEAATEDTAESSEPLPRTTRGPEPT